jgi:RsiW-degrading membrane proteinase PrsW (M82 family)
MIRIVIENVLLFLLPTLIYVVYVYIRGREQGNETPVLNDAPLIWLFLAGVVLMLSVLLVFGSTSGWQSGLPYQPPVYKDGRIEPGHVAQ